jgi:hypothetical protein
MHGLWPLLGLGVILLLGAVGCATLLGLWP